MKRTRRNMVASHYCEAWARGVFVKFGVPRRYTAGQHVVSGYGRAAGRLASASISPRASANFCSAAATSAP